MVCQDMVLQREGADCAFRSHQRPASGRNAAGRRDPARPVGSPCANRRLVRRANARERQWRDLHPERGRGRRSQLQRWRAGRKPRGRPTVPGGDDQHRQSLGLPGGKVQATLYLCFRRGRHRKRPVSQGYGSKTSIYWLSRHTPHSDLQGTVRAAGRRAARWSRRLRKCAPRRRWR